MCFDSKLLIRNNYRYRAGTLFKDRQYRYKYHQSQHVITCQARLVIQQNPVCSLSSSLVLHLVSPLSSECFLSEAKSKFFILRSSSFIITLFGIIFQSVFLFYLEKKELRKKAAAVAVAPLLVVECSKIRASQISLLLLHLLRINKGNYDFSLASFIYSIATFSRFRLCSFRRIAFACFIRRIFAAILNARYRFRSLSPSMCVCVFSFHLSANS